MRPAFCWDFVTIPCRLCEARAVPRRGRPSIGAMRLCCACLIVVCSLLVAPVAVAAKRATVTGELQRLADEGALPPEVAAADRAVYDDAKTHLKKLTGARAVQL